MNEIEFLFNLSLFFMIGGPVLALYIRASFCQTNFVGFVIPSKWATLSEICFLGFYIGFIGMILTVFFVLMGS